MTKNDNILDELFRSKLDAFEQDPPPYVWDRILEQRRSGKRKRLFFFLRGGGIAAAVLLAFLLGRLFDAKQPPYQEREIPAVAEQIPDTEKHNSPELGQKDEHLKDSRINGHDYLSDLQLQIPLPEQLSNIRTTKETGKTTAALKQKIQQENSLFLSRRSYPLLALQGTELKLPEQAFPLETKLKADRRETGKRLSARDLAIIEMNKKLLESENPGTPEHEWSIGGYIAPAYSGYQTSYSDAYERTLANEGENGNVHLNGGVQIRYKAKGSRWSLESGIYYSHLGQSSGESGSSSVNGYMSDVMSGNGGNYITSPVSFNKGNKLYVESGETVMNASAGVIEIENLPANARITTSLETASPNSEILLSSGDVDQSFRYLEVPLFIRYQLIDKKIGVGLMGGVSTNILVGNDVYMQDGGEKTKIGKTKDMNLLNYAATVGIGMGYQLNDKIQFHVEPRLRYFMNSLNSNNDVTFKPYSIGFYTGVSYRF